MDIKSLLGAVNPVAKGPERERGSGRVCRFMSGHYRRLRFQRCLKTECWIDTGFVGSLFGASIGGVSEMRGNNWNGRGGAKHIYWIKSPNHIISGRLAQLV